MRITNLALHITAAILLGMDTLTIFVAFLWSLGFVNSSEFAMGLTALLVFGLVDVFALIVGLILMVTYASIKPRTYAVLEIITHVLPTICFAAAIVYIIVANMQAMMHRNPVLSPAVTPISVVDIAGFAIGIAGIIVTAVGTRKRIHNN